jgi:hypothetical protein
VSMETPAIRPADYGQLGSPEMPFTVLEYRCLSDLASGKDFNVEAWGSATTRLRVHDFIADKGAGLALITDLGLAALERVRAHGTA